MRIALFVKSKRRTQTTRSIARALVRAGHSIRVVREGKRRRLMGRRLARSWTLASVRRFSPDFVFIHAQDVSRPLFEALASQFPTVMFTPDCWPSPVTAEQLGIAAHVDLLCTVAAGQIAELERAGVARAAYLAEAHDPELHYPVERASEELTSEVAFIGKFSLDSPLHATRGALLGLVAHRFDTRLYGRGWEALGLTPTLDDVYPEQYREICCSAQIVLGCDWRHDVRWYFSNRTWFTLGCGGFLITNYAPGLEDIFENHRQLVWYRSVDECADLIEHYLSRPDERARIAAEGHAYVRSHRSYDHFARDLIDLFEGRAPKFPPAAGEAP
jgi:spore maturation protein CgeB